MRSKGPDGAPSAVLTVVRASEADSSDSGVLKGDLLFTLVAKSEPANG